MSLGFLIYCFAWIEYRREMEENVKRKDKGQKEEEGFLWAKKQQEMTNSEEGDVWDCVQTNCFTYALKIKQLVTNHSCIYMIMKQFSMHVCTIIAAKVAVIGSDAAGPIHHHHPPCNTLLADPTSQLPPNHRPDGPLQRLPALHTWYEAIRHLITTKLWRSPSWGLCCNTGHWRESWMGGGRVVHSLTAHLMD